MVDDLNDGGLDGQEPGAPGSPAWAGASEESAAAGAGDDSDGGSDAPAAEPAEERALAEMKDRYLRLAAEYDNFRKRSARERADAGARAQGELMKQLLDPLDDLGRVAHVQPSTTDAGSVIAGVDLVEKKFAKALAAAGLEIIYPLDEPFNPELHEAITTTPALSPEDDHMVAQVFQPGYAFKGMLLRPARVVVKQWTD